MDIDTTRRIVKPIVKKEIKETVREVRIALREGNYYLEEEKPVLAYQCYQEAEHLLYKAKDLIVNRNADQISTRTDTSSDQQKST